MPLDPPRAPRRAAPAAVLVIGLLAAAVSLVRAGEPDPPADAGGSVAGSTPVVAEVDASLHRPITRTTW